MAEPAYKQAVVLASGNAGKLRELSEVLAPLGVMLKPQSDFNVPEVDETGLSFVENAIIKARAAASHPFRGCGTSMSSSACWPTTRRHWSPGTPRNR